MSAANHSTKKKPQNMTELKNVMRRVTLRSAKHEDRTMSDRTVRLTTKKQKLPRWL